MTFDISADTSIHLPDFNRYLFICEFDHEFNTPKPDPELPKGRCPICNSAAVEDNPLAPRKTS